MFICFILITQTDPVTLGAAYRSQWSSVRAPGERSHAQLRHATHNMIRRQVRTCLCNRSRNNFHNLLLYLLAGGGACAASAPHHRQHICGSHRQEAPRTAVERALAPGARLVACLCCFVSLLCGNIWYFGECSKPGKVDVHTSCTDLSTTPGSTGG